MIMSWQAILKSREDYIIVKAIPPSELRLAMIIQQDGLTEKTVNSEKIKINSTYPGFLGTIRCLKE